MVHPRPGFTIVRGQMDASIRCRERPASRPARGGARRAAWASIVVLGALAGCATVPYTNRSQLMMMPASDEMALGADAYKQVLSSARVVRDPALTAPVVDIGTRIAAVAEKPEYRWEFTVIDDAGQANAFALPGGKVAVYTGLYPVAQDTCALAAVMAHEVAHALARHGAERMSQSQLLQIGAVGLAIGLGGQSAAVRNTAMQAFGLGAQVGVMLPFSRSQEAEADHIGLILMARAGYDPTCALTLWERMEARSEGAQPLEFLSTHPGYGTRQEHIRKWLPEARRYYQPNAAAQTVALPPIPKTQAAPGRR